MNQEVNPSTQDIAAQPKAIRVATIIDPRTIVLNVGRSDGIRADASFLIYGNGEEIIDPETQESLGILELVRGRGKVIHLQDKFCTVESTTVKTVPGIKKIIRQERAGLNRSVFARANPLEEIFEGARTLDMPFSGILVGDYARKI